MVTASGSEVQQAGVAGLARVQAFLSVLSQRRVRIGNLSRFGDGHGFRSFTEAIAKTAHPKIKAPPTHPEVWRLRQIETQLFAFGTLIALLYFGSGPLLTVSAVKSGIETRQCLNCSLRWAV